MSAGHFNSCRKLGYGGVSVRHVNSAVSCRRVRTIIGRRTIVCVQNKNGENIITYSPSKKFSSVIISSPDIIQGESYSIYYGGSSSGTAKDGLYSGGEYSGGTLLETVTAESAVTQAGTGTFGQMGGIGRGGMQVITEV